jgi:ectoine hydroxylase-related dioxygenase (phytanoyl-CoA dioxygenase family)
VDNTTCSSNTLHFNKDGEIYFHVDYPYHDLGSSNFELLVQVIITLNDFTIKNGATVFIGKASTLCPRTRK